jgi:hypothetical protein
MAAADTVIDIPEVREVEEDIRKKYPYIDKIARLAKTDFR